MRIIGGEAGGRTIRAPRGTATRPTSDRVKEAVFNILGPPAPGTRVLDLYAGSGALGLEALSRGAAAAVFVDQGAEPCRVLGRNLDELGYRERARVLRAPVASALGQLDRAGETPFGWVFLDPPYATDEVPRTLQQLGGERARLLGGDAVVVVEHDKRRAPEGGYGVLAMDDRRRWGDTEVSFYRRAA